MAIIQTIRDKYAKVAGGIIVLSLVGFVLMDASSGGGGGLFSPDTTVGSINGEDVEYDAFEQAVTNYEAQYKQQNQIQSLDEAQSAGLRDQVWNQLVNEKILNDIYKKIGITVSDEELQDLLTGENPDPIVMQSFTRPGEPFNPEFVAEQIEQIKSDPAMKAQWDAFIKDLIARREYAKFTAMINGSVYTPKFIIDQDADARASYASIDYVQIPYSSIPDAEVKPTDDELNAYIANHKAQFTVKEGSRAIEYVAFKVKPNAADSAKALSDITIIKDAFSKEMSDDELNQFISFNSDMQSLPAYFTREQLNKLANAEEIWNAPINTVVGPFNDGNGMVLAKVLSKSTMPDSIKVRHVLVSTEQQRNPVLADSLAKARIDSVQALAQAGVNFDSLVKKYSTDQGSIDKGGVYEFTLANKATLSKEFGDFIFSGKAGDKKVVKVSNDSYSGYHYIEILSSNSPVTVTKVANVNKELIASSEAFTEVYAKASDFASKAKDATSFSNTTKEMVINTDVASNINANSSVVQGIGSSRDLVKWVYGAKLGSTSGVITVGDQYVVALLKDVQEPGLMKLNDQTRTYVESMVIKEKKTQKIIEKYKGAASLETLAQSNNTTVAHADSVNYLQAFIPNMGVEAKLAGYIFSADTKPNTVSQGIAGNMGVFFVKVISKFKQANTERNLVMERNMANGQLKASIVNMVIGGLKEAAKVEDNRGKFF